MKRLAITILFLFAYTTFASAQPTFDFNALLSTKRVSDPQLSPDGKKVLYTVGVVDRVANRVVNHIFRVDIDGSDRKQLTSGDRSHSSPRWSPDGDRIAFVTGGQIWVMEDDGDDKEQITDIATGASGPVWSPDGKLIAFVSDVYPECTTMECNKTEEEKATSSKVQAKITDRLLYRHWVEWRDRKRTHVLVVSSEGGAVRDLTPGDFDAPPYGAASGVDYAFSPDSKELAYLRNPDRVEATSTNSDIYLLPLTGGTARNITASNRGYDNSPVYSSDGRYLLYRSQATPAFEADRWRIMRYDRKTGQTVELTRGFDLQADDIVISPDNKTVFFTANERGRSSVFSVPMEPDFRQRIATHVRKVGGIFSNFATVSGLSIAQDGEHVLFAANSMSRAPEIFSGRLDKDEVRELSKANTPLRLTQPEDIEWRGAMNTNIHGFVVKPADFDPKKRYPLLVLIHGGPQGAWNDSWSTRWNPQLWANQGYVVFLPNPRGSTGYGQKFVDDISGDWGGKVFVDLKNGVAEMIKRPYVDPTRIGAAGASYGGYMVDWILGHNSDPRFRFKALHSHAGVFNLESMAMSTEELWFTNWEFKGMPWENPAMYNRWSPHKFVQRFNTPTLVTAGELDYRVPVDQSYQLFTALQLRNVDSRMVIFPDEGHWILKPQNSELWHKEVFAWFKKHLNP
ncbi:MAG: S9 family peptidase [Pyrinomonadaceae bacterium]|nr:S9 family peptidase [Pyrinomonadaceae bacterium]